MPISRGMAKEDVAKELHKKRRQLGKIYKDAAPPLFKEYILYATESYIEAFRGQDTDNARMFRKNHIQPNINFETEDTYASYRMVEAGLGVSLSNYIETKERSAGKSVKLLELNPPQLLK